MESGSGNTSAISGTLGSDENIRKSFRLSENVQHTIFGSIKSVISFISMFTIQCAGLSRYDRP